MACQLHRKHIPTPLRTVGHHIQPLAMGGADIDHNKVETCDNGHYNVHRLLGDLIRDGRMRLGGTRSERKTALAGYQAWCAAGKPGQPVFELHSEETA
jgi:hypothetical protein